MLDLSRRLNPECEHIRGDMRTVRLGRLFDCVLLHDAVNYMTSLTDLASAVATAFAHTAPGGVAMFQPDFVSETFEPGTETGGGDEGDRSLRYIEWLWDPDPEDTAYVADMAYLLREGDGEVEVVHDRHLLGLFPRNAWLEMIAQAGFKPMAIPFENSSNLNDESEVFLGLRPIDCAGHDNPTNPPAD
jgi:hypothetical protein